MFISNVTNQGLSSAVWANATRTLTADPATDAGAATLVWTHAARTLTSLPVQEINDEGANGLSATSSAVQNTFGAYVQVVSSTAHAVRGVEVTMGQLDAAAAISISIGTGAGGSEVNKCIFRVAFNNANPSPVPVRYLDSSLIPKGVRVAVAIANNSAAAARSVNLGVTLIEDNS